MVGILRKISISFIILLVVIMGYKSFVIVPTESKILYVRFGKYLGEDDAGWKWKNPFTKIYKYDVSEVRRFEYGEVTGVVGQQGEENVVEQKMITSDTKLINVSWVVQWNITEPYQYWLVNKNNKDFRFLAGIAEAEFRKSVASMNYEETLGEGKEKLSYDAQNRINNEYKRLGVGIRISRVNISDVKVPTDVRPAFNEVENARQERDKKINDAETYTNKLMETAKGDADVMLNEAQEYAVKKEADAKAMVARLNSLGSLYRTNPQLVRTNLWYENIETILPKFDITFIDGTTNNNIFLNGTPFIPVQK